MPEELERLERTLRGGWIERWLAELANLGLPDEMADLDRLLANLAKLGFTEELADLERVLADLADLGLPEELALERLERCWWARRLRAAAEKAVAGGRVSEARPEEGSMPWRRSGRGVLWVMVAREAGTPWTWPDELARLLGCRECWQSWRTGRPWRGGGSRADADAGADADADEVGGWGSCRSGRLRRSGGRGGGDRPRPSPVRPWRGGGSWRSVQIRRQRAGNRA